MLTVDSKTVTEIRKESRHFSARLVFDSKNYDEIDSFTYMSHYSPQKFTVGCVPSASVQCDIRGLTASLPSNLKGQVFRLEISVGEKTENYTPEWISLGEFKITEASVIDGVFSLTAYDKINFIKGDYKSNLTGTQKSWTEYQNNKAEFAECQGQECGAWRDGCCHYSNNK